MRWIKDARHVGAGACEANPHDLAMQAPCTVVLVKEDLPVLTGADPDDD